METDVKCSVERCVYNFDNVCSRKEIRVALGSISGIPRYAVCLNFKTDTASQPAVEADASKCTCWYDGCTCEYRDNDGVCNC